MKRNKRVGLYRVCSCGGWQLMHLSVCGDALPYIWLYINNALDELKA